MTESSPSCGPETIVVAPDGKAWTVCACGANLLAGDLFAHLTEVSAQ